MLLRLVCQLLPRMPPIHSRLLTDVEAFLKELNGSELDGHIGKRALLHSQRLFTKVPSKTRLQLAPWDASVHTHFDDLIRGSLHSDSQILPGLRRVGLDLDIIDRADSKLQHCICHRVGHDILSEHSHRISGKTWRILAG